MGQTTERWQRLESLFEEAVALPPAERTAFINARCAGDDGLRARLGRMLESDEDRGVLDHGAMPASGLPAAEPAATLVGRRIAGFEIIRVIASGGMGVVYEARQEHPSRLVALKMLSAAFPSPEARQRFEFEAEIHARLQHPAIAAIYASGILADDAADRSPHPATRPFFVMELVHGEPITRFADEHRLNLRERVSLLIQVCEGVEHAHSRGVIHRDLKPANILVVAPPADGLKPVGPAPKILDFGIARAVDFGAAASHRTLAGQLLGTPAYMSPEQIAGDATRIDIRSDVYALGVITYELLGGRTPHDLTTASLTQAAHVILEREPVPLGAIDRRCRGDLEIIVARALEKDPDRRYPSASQLADDLRRWLDHQPISARRASRMYQMRKFARRNRVLVGGMLAVLITLTLGVAATAWQWRQAATQRDHAERARQRAENAEALSLVRLEQTQNSVAEMLDFADKQLSDLPGGAAAREAMALAGLQRLEVATAATPAHDRSPGTLYLLGYAYQRVGEAQLANGRSAQSLERHHAALAIRQALADAHAEDYTYPRALAVNHWKLAETLLTMGRHDEAREHAQHALRINQSIADRGDDSLRDRLIYLGMSLRRVAEIDALEGDHAAALAGHREALRLLDEAAAQGNITVSALRTRAIVLRAMGENLTSAGDSAAAIDPCNAAMQQIEQLRERAGAADAWERAAAARTGAMLALALAAGGRNVEAQAAMTVALRDAASLLAADPASFESRQLQAWCWMQSATLAANRGEQPERHRLLAQAGEMLLPLVAFDPLNARVRLNALDCCEALATDATADDATLWRTRAATLK